MAFKKYIRKAAKKGVRFAKKRYTTRGGSGLRVNRLAKDVMAIKRSLNVEHKHIDYHFGSASSITAQLPTKQNPVILPLNVPTRGTSYNQRVGNQLRVTHMTSKLQFTFHNNSDLTQRQMARCRIIFAKNASDVPLIANLLDQDANGHYTPMSFINTQEYKKYLWMKQLDIKSSYTQPTNRYPLSDSGKSTENPRADLSTNFQVDITRGGALNIANFFKRAEAKTSVRMFFENGTDNVEQMKPYMLLTSDVIEATGDNYDYIAVSGSIRMTYVDN